MAANAAAVGAESCLSVTSLANNNTLVQVFGGGIDGNKGDAQKLAILDLFDSIRTVTGGLVDPYSPPNIQKLMKDQEKARVKESADEGQALTLVHVSAQHKRFLWDRGHVQGLHRGCLRGVRGHKGCLGCIACQKRLKFS
jgi:hypothetical protein